MAMAEYERRAGLLGVILLAWLAACSGPAWAIDADIKPKLVYNIAYALNPIDVEINVKGGNPDATTYHVYDVYKKEVAKGKLGATRTVTFTPPQYGWYLFWLEENGAGPGAFIGVTGEFPGTITLKNGDLQGGWNDMALQAFAGLMLDRTNTRMGLDYVLKKQADADKYGVTLLVQFESAPDQDHVRQAVTTLKGRVKYYELVNEPNFSMNPDQYSELVKRVVPLIKSIDPEAKVMGPDTCGVYLGWYRRLYETGAARLLDALSIHDYENDGEPWFYRWKMGELRKILAKHGDEKKEIWQTERAAGAVFVRIFSGPAQAASITLQRDMLQAWAGIDNNHNSHYYANVTGYNDMPTFIYSGSGPHPAALATRTRHAMTSALGRKFVKTLDFGPTGNKLLLGLLYQGEDGATVTLRNLGTRDWPVKLGVTGGNSLEVVDCFGNVEKVPVEGGKATVTAKVLPCYLRLAKGQTVSPPNIDFGANIAKEAEFVYSGGVKQGNKDTLTNGIPESAEGLEGPSKTTWQGVYPGKEFNESSQTLDMTFKEKREISGLIVYGVGAFIWHSPILAYDLQYNDGGKWVTVEEMRATNTESVLVTTFMCDTATWYTGASKYVHHFPQPIKTDKLRMVVRRIARGCWIDMLAEKARWKASGEVLELREIEIYGPPQKAK